MSRKKRSGNSSSEIQNAAQDAQKSQTGRSGELSKQKNSTAPPRIPSSI